jgi:hypothetical protein
MMPALPDADRPAQRWARMLLLLMFFIVFSFAAML